MKRWKDMKKRDRYLIVAMGNLAWYCVAALTLAAWEKTVPDSLTVAWFAAWTTELALLAGIRLKGE